MCFDQNICLSVCHNQKCSAPLTTNIHCTSELKTDPVCDKLILGSSGTTITRETRLGTPRPPWALLQNTPWLNRLWNQRRLLYVPAFILKNQNNWRYKGKPSQGNQAEAQEKTKRWIVNLDKCPGFHSRRLSDTPEAVLGFTPVPVDCVYRGADGPAEVSWALQRYIRLSCMLRSRDRCDTHVIYKQCWCVHSWTTCVWFCISPVLMAAESADQYVCCLFLQ